MAASDKSVLKFDKLASVQVPGDNGSHEGFGDSYWCMEAPTLQQSNFVEAQYGGVWRPYWGLAVLCLS